MESQQGMELVLKVETTQQLLSNPQEKPHQRHSLRDTSRNLGSISSQLVILRGSRISPYAISTFCTQRFVKFPPTFIVLYFIENPSANPPGYLSHPFDRLSFCFWLFFFFFFGENPVSSTQSTCSLSVSKVCAGLFMSKVLG